MYPKNLNFFLNKVAQFFVQVLIQFWKLFWAVKYGLISIMNWVWWTLHTKIWGGLFLKPKLANGYKTFLYFKQILDIQ